ncbi:MAG: phosphate acyltransferase PlsX [Gemmatimonadales bacterium]|nr:phosphate acyltransferase PlsX [Gemmatimonadota bacterium]MCL4213439.1 phosphate acyltransferase PlsX [Gemmatimonadales bacterium]
MARIALDAMGGDLAPAAPVAAALLAARELGAGHTLQLVGRTAAVREQLDAQLAAAADRDTLSAAAARFELIDAPDVIEMTDKPSVAIRGKPNSSMAVGIRLQAEGKSDAFVSAGNTGAQMAASTFVLRLHEGLTRPAIATVFPTARQPVVVLDAGANVDCSAKELVQFARLGSVYARDILGRTDPAVGLLSIGEEPEKGNAAVKEAHQLLLGAGLNFIGNVEGRDIPHGACDRGPVDVVVCDGFTGNVLLKFYESVAPMLFGMLAKAGVTREQLGAVVHAMDYAKYGGAPLLGVKGVSIICHGKSSPEAIKNGILAGLRAVESGMSRHIEEQLAP